MSKDVQQPENRNHQLDRGVLVVFEICLSPHMPLREIRLFMSDSSVLSLSNKQHPVLGLPPKYALGYLSSIQNP